LQHDDGGVALEQGEEVDSSYHYYDNLRGKINSRILTELVTGSIQIVRALKTQMQNCTCYSSGSILTNS
jgi:hypothetical protein